MSASNKSTASSEESEKSQESIKIGQMTKDEFWPEYNILKYSFKTARNDFLKFINYYNEHKESINLNFIQRNALSNLHELWKTTTNKTWNDEVGDFWIMKAYHEELNPKLLPGSEVYKNYIISAQVFRNRLGLLLKNVTPAKDIPGIPDPNNPSSTSSTRYGRYVGGGSVMLNPFAFRGVLKNAVAVAKNTIPTEEPKSDTQPINEVEVSRGRRVIVDSEEAYNEMMKQLEIQKEFVINDCIFSRIGEGGMAKPDGNVPK